MKTPILTSIYLFIFLNTQLFFCQLGTLDPTFGVGGKVITSFGVDSNPMDIVMQSDGKLIVVASITPATSTAACVMLTRYLSNGNLDMTFGNSGYVINLVGISCQPSRIALQNNGKIVVTGSTFISNSGDFDIMVLRYNTNGTLDSSFDNDGIKIVPQNNSQTTSAILIQSNGKIIVGGRFTSTTNPSLDTFGITRFNIDGSLDTTFGSNGLVYTPNIYRGGLNDLKFIENENIIAVGNLEFPYKYAIVKYDSNGNVINSFGTQGNGIVQESLNQYASLRSCVISSDNNIYASGDNYNGTKFNGFAVKYNSNGIIDNTFANNGVLARDFGGVLTNLAIDIKIDSNNKLVIGYAYGIPTDWDFGLEVYSLNGLLDTTFGTNGLFVTTFGYGHEYFRKMLIQPDNKIVMTGFKGTQVLARINNSNILNSNNFDSNDANFIVSPNPVTENSQFIFDLKTQVSAIDINVYDSKGLLINKLIQNENYFTGKNFIKCDFFNSIPNGIYFIKVYFDGIFFKIIKIVK